MGLCCQVTVSNSELLIYLVRRVVRTDVCSVPDKVILVTAGRQPLMAWSSVRRDVRTYQQELSKPVYAETAHWNYLTQSALCLFNGYYLAPFSFFKVCHRLSYTMDKSDSILIQSGDGDGGGGGGGVVGYRMDRKRLESG